MANPTRSLNVQIDWRKLLHLLELEETTWTLPTDVACPICHQGLAQIYEDAQVGGQWFACGDCGNSGDMIELAAKAWQATIPDAIARLVELGVCDRVDEADIAQYQAQHVQYRQRLAALWADAARDLSNPTSEARHLSHVLNVRCDVAPSRWMAGPGGILGGLDTYSIERAFAPKVMDHADEKGQRCSPSAHSIFKGPGWRDALIVPYYDLPGRICAFLFVGRDTQPDDFVFRRANFGSRSNHHRRVPLEAGLVMHPGTLAAADAWKRTVIATSEPLLMLALQMRNFEQSHRPLPMVAWHDSLIGPKSQRQPPRVRTLCAWQMLGNRQIVMWMPQTTSQALWQAIRNNMLISTVGPRTAGKAALREYVSKYTPRDLAHHIIKSAKPWPETVARLFRDLNDAAVSKIVRRLRFEGIDIEREFAVCDRATRQRLNEILQINGERSCRLFGAIYVEKDNQWFRRHPRRTRDEVVSDAIFRIEHQLVHPANRQVHYRGHIRFQDHVVEFCAPAEQIEKNSWRWLRGELGKHGIAGVLTNPRDAQIAHQVARLFHPPQVGEAIDTVGWSHQVAGFVTPNFIIDGNNPPRPLETGIFAADAPARSLAWSAYPLPHDLAHGTPTYWALLAAVLENIACSAEGEPPHGIGLHGANAVALGERIARAIGCCEYDLCNQPDVVRALASEGRHQWPVLVRFGNRLRRQNRQLLLQQVDCRNLLTQLSWHEARILAVLGNWHVITDDSAATPCNDRLFDDPGILAKNFVPAYLHHYAKGGLIRERRSRLRHGNRIAEILTDMANYVKRHQGDPQCVAAAEQLIWPATKQGNGQAMGELLVRLIREGQLHITSGLAASRRIAILLEQNNGRHYYLSRAALDRLLRPYPTPPIPPARITAALEQAKALVAVDDLGWTMRANWIEQLRVRDVCRLANAL